MKGIVAILIMMVFIISIASVNAAYAGGDEDSGVQASKKNLEPSSAEAKKIRTLANMDFTYPAWKEPPHGQNPTKEKKDKFEGAAANYGPGNVGKQVASATGKTTGYTLTGLVKDTGNALAESGSAMKGVKNKIRGSEPAPSEK